MVQNVFLSTNDIEDIDSNDSSKNRMYRKNSTLVKNKYNKYEIKDKPDKIRCNNNEINITITLKR